MSATCVGCEFCGDICDQGPGGTCAGECWCALCGCAVLQTSGDEWRRGRCHQ